MSEALYSRTLHQPGFKLVTQRTIGVRNFADCLNDHKARHERPVSPVSIAQACTKKLKSEVLGKVQAS